MTKVHFERDDHSYHITLDDPPLHILDIAMLEELRDAISKIKDDRHCMIIASTSDWRGAPISTSASLRSNASTWKS